jgi:SRSO17 transposase
MAETSFLVLQPQLAGVGFTMMADAARGVTMVRTTRAWARELEQLHARIAHRFRRAEPRRRSLAYLKALAASVERKNGWQMAEAVGDSTPDGVQRLLNQAEWDAEEVRDDLREYVVEHFADERAVLVVDETGFLKKGTKSAGVQPQYSGTAGKKENCQIGVFLCYASEKGAAFVDRALYLPKKSWANDAERRAEASIPKDVEFATKPELARGMLERAFEAEVPAAWVTADTIYGGDRRLRMFLEQSARPFVLAVKRSEPLWADTDRGPGQVRADVLVERARAGDWKRLSAGEGAKGPRLYNWALLPLFRLQITEEERRFEHLLLVRRSLEDPRKLAYYVVFAPKGTPLEELVRVAGSRWRIESCLEQAKGGFGLDEYEVRHWEAWHRHVTLSLLAHAFVSAS